MPVNLNIVSARPSQKPSIASLGRPLTWESATANRIEKNTIWRTSLFAAASKKLCGTRCSRIPLNVVVFCASCCPGSAEATSFTPTPGLVRFTAASPMNSATVVTISK